MQSRRAAVPLVLSSILFFGVAVLSWWRLRHWSGLALTVGVAVSLGYLAWIMWESRVSLRDSRSKSVRSDRWTAEAYALSHGATALTALLFESQWPLRAEGCIVGGALLFAGGVALRLAAVRELGRFYSHRVRLAEDHQLVQTGPYRYLRHPAYSGMLLAHVGFVMVFCNAVSVAVLVGALLPTIITRILIEERALGSLRGYAAFCQGRARLVPRIW